jgi:hypothetical protein
MLFGKPVEHFAQGHGNVGVLSQVVVGAGKNDSKFVFKISFFYF